MVRVGGCGFGTVTTDVDSSGKRASAEGAQLAGEKLCRQRLPARTTDQSHVTRSKNQGNATGSAATVQNPVFEQSNTLHVLYYEQKR